MINFEAEKRTGERSVRVDRYALRIPTEGAVPAVQTEGQWTIKLGQLLRPKKPRIGIKHSGMTGRRVVWMLVGRHGGEAELPEQGGVKLRAGYDDIHKLRAALSRRSEETTA